MNEQKKEPTQQVESAEPVSATQDLREVPFSEVKRIFKKFFDAHAPETLVAYLSTDFALNTAKDIDIPQTMPGKLY